MEMNAIEIVTLPVAEWQAYRKLRLEMLRESPQAFSSTFQEQQLFHDSFWQGRLSDAARGERSWLLFARAGEDLVGMIGAFSKDPDDPQDIARLATIISVYVTPPARGKGISSLLMQAILTKLTQSGFQKVQLGVTSDQTAAVHLYQRFGFTVIKTETEQMGDGLIHVGLLMEKTL